MHSEYCKAPLHHTAPRFFRHKGQNLKAAGLKTSNNSSSVWFHALRVSLCHHDKHESHIKQTKAVQPLL